MTRVFRQVGSPAWRNGAIIAGLVLLAACAPRPVERPREGAPPIANSTPVRLENAVPPTLIPPGSLVQTPTATPEPAPSPDASPPPAVAASPPPSPGAPPIIAGLQPAPGAALPPGDVTIGARVSAVNDLVEVLAFVDGESIPIDVGGADVRVKVVSLVRSFASGTHEVRIQARDETGQLGGYRWQFSVGAAKPQPVTPAAGPTARPAAPAGPTRTPVVVPTRRPTTPPAPKPAAPKPTAVPAR